eukprot:4904075-Amphidinium_carterae.1
MVKHCKTRHFAEVIFPSKYLSGPRPPPTIFRSESPFLGASKSLVFSLFILVTIILISVLRHHHHHHHPPGFPSPAIVIVHSEVAIVDEVHYIKSASSLSASHGPCLPRGGNR